MTYNAVVLHRNGATEFHGDIETMQKVVSREIVNQREMLHMAKGQRDKMFEQKVDKYNNQPKGNRWEYFRDTLGIIAITVLNIMEFLSWIEYDGGK